MSAKFIIQKSSDGQYYFVLKAANGETILNSERYTRRKFAYGGIYSVIVNGKNPDRYTFKKAVTNQPYFVLEARNGKTIGTSETYSGMAAAINGRDAIINSLADVKIQDKT